MSVVIDGTSGITFPDSSSQSAAAASGYPAQAWVNFNGTGTVAIRDDGNVSSITDHGTGDYTVNLSSSLSTSSPSVTITVNEDSWPANNWNFYGTGGPSASAVRLLVWQEYNSTHRDAAYVCVTFVG